MNGYDYYHVGPYLSDSKAVGVTSLESNGLNGHLLDTILYIIKGHRPCKHRHIEEHRTRGYVLVAEEDEQHPVTRYDSLEVALDRLITFLPEDVHRSRRSASEDHGLQLGDRELAKINAHLEECPEDWSPVCALCEARTQMTWCSSREYADAVLMHNPWRIALHLRTK